MSKISKGAMEIQRVNGRDFNSITYRIACSCTDPECDLNLNLTFYKDDKELALTFYRKVKYYTDHEDTEIEKKLRLISQTYKFGSNMNSFFYTLYSLTGDIVNLYRRLRDAYKVLFNKEISLEGGLIIWNEENIENLINTLIEGMNVVYPSKSRMLITTRYNKDNII